MTPMSPMRNLFAAALVWLGFAGAALAQGSNVGNLPAWGVAGNPTASAAPPAQADLSTLFDGKFCSTSGSFMERGASAWNCQTSLQTQTLLSIFAKPGGRLTLTSATPVMTATASAQTSVFYAPYVSPYVPIYNGTQVGIYQFTSSNSDTVGLTLTLGSNWAANAAYDVFVFLNSGTVTLCTVTWTNTTTRATALAIFGGILTNGASATCRTTNAATVTLAQNQGTYLGSFYTNGSTGTVDYIFGAAASGGTAASLGIWNYYNRVMVVTTVTDTNGSYTSNQNGTIREAGGSTTNIVKFITGVVEDGVVASVNAQSATAASAGASASWGVGCNSTTAFTGNPATVKAVNAVALQTGGAATAQCSPPIGVYTISSNETSSNNTTTFNVNSTNTLTVQLRM